MSFLRAELVALLCVAAFLCHGVVAKTFENASYADEGGKANSLGLDKAGGEFEEGGDPLNATGGANETGHHGEHHEKRFHLFTMDFNRVQTPMIIGLWLFCACLGKIAFHMTPRLSNMLPESCLLIVMGFIIGAVFIYANPNPVGEHVSPLTANTFFLYLLPPIILDAGYFMPNRLFFDHLGTILVFAVVGTIWNIMTIGVSMYALSLTGLFGDVDDFPVLHIFLFSSLISAVDPVAVLAVFEEIHVEEVLFILVFGESLLNDGVTVVLYHMFEGFSEIGDENLQAQDVIYGLISFFLVALGGTIIGILWGFLAAFVTRFTHQVRVIEPVFVFVMSYLAYLNAELFHWSGILSITFCGITMKNYTEQNMSQKSQTTTKYAMKMMASSAETVIFLFLGVATVHGTQHNFNGWFTLMTIIFCSVYRVLGVLILSAMCNRFRVNKIDFVQKFVMSYGGLRGAVAFALAITIDQGNIPLASMFVTTTIVVVFFTVFIQGITIKPLVEKLGVKKSEKRKLNMNERLHGRSMDYIMAGVEDITGKFGNHYIRGWFKRININYLQPCFVNAAGKAKEPKLFETLSHLKMQDALNYMKQKPQNFADLESFSKVLQKNLYSRNSVREWNLDVGELEYKAGDRDINDAKFHHILADDFHLIKSRRQSTYKRHAVRDDDLQTQTDFHNKMYQRARQVAMTSIRNRKVRRPGQMDSADRTERQIQQQQNGTAVRLRTDYLEETARDNPAFEGDTEDGGKPVTTKKNTYLDRSAAQAKRQSKKGPSIAETILPWKRFLDDENPSTNSKMKRSMSIFINTEKEMEEDLPPTMAEIQLPWKRNEDGLFEEEPNRQSEFPPWAHNKNYIDYYSPSNTVLGMTQLFSSTGKVVGVPEKRPTLKDLFMKRHSSANLFGGSRRGSAVSNTEEMASLRNSAKDDIYLRRSSLKDDPTAHRRESLKDFKDLNAFRASLAAAELARLQQQQPQQQQQQQHQLLHEPHPDRRSSRESLGFDSLLKTVIVEDEERTPPNPRVPRVPSKDHVITMNPAGSHNNLTTGDTQL